MEYMKTISALKARGRLGTILDDVSQSGAHYVIERFSKPLVAVIPFGEYQDYVKTTGIKKMKAEKAQLLSAILAFRKKFGKKYATDKDSTVLLREFRNNY